ncbi:hypothetical protein K502DRAFT_42677 [Neoconidiobolus thromboides FSU 785]|nr:hypothetical protein K502DRAFT_42677 [Neoconidiobolus thromboides FSU 785]
MLKYNAPINSIEEAISILETMLQFGPQNLIQARLTYEQRKRIGHGTLIILDNEVSTIEDWFDGKMWSSPCYCDFYLEYLGYDSTNKNLTKKIISLTVNDKDLFHIIHYLDAKPNFKQILSNSDGCSDSIIKADYSNNPSGDTIATTNMNNKIIKEYNLIKYNLDHQKKQPKLSNFDNDTFSYFED